MEGDIPEFLTPEVPANEEIREKFQTRLKEKIQSLREKFNQIKNKPNQTLVWT